MSADETLSHAADWAETHKPVAIGVVGGVAALFVLLMIRRRNSANGTSGATAAGVGSASLVPYGDATSMGFTGLTGIQDATTGGFAGITDQLAGISGLLTTMQPPGTATSGGSDTGNTIPTAGAAGSGATTGATAQPAFLPADSAPILTPTAAAPATLAAPQSSYTAPAPYQPAYAAPYSASIPDAVAQVGGGVPLAQRTNVGGLRALTSFSSADQATIRSGGTVVGGDGRVFKNVIGADGTPHATSIGMIGQVI